MEGQEGGWQESRGVGGWGQLTLCLQPESLNGHSTSAVLQLSFRWPGRSSRATEPTPHWLGQGTGKRGHWYWWL